MSKYRYDKSLFLVCKMAERCFECFRPQSHCLCEYAKPVVESGIKFIFLMHPKEARHQRTGTGRLSHIALKDSEIIVGIDFSKNQHFLDLINDEKYFPMLMYPGEDAWNAKKEGFSGLFLYVLPGLSLLLYLYSVHKVGIKHSLFQCLPVI